MPVWDNVTSVTDIKLYYDFGEPSANIYGNERNCVALNIAFNAKKATELVDLSGQDLSEHVRLINFESLVPLARESQDSASNSLFYKREASDFEAQLMVQPHASQPDKSQMRARVRLYVYAKAETNFTSNIAVRFLLPSGKAQDTSAEQGFPQKLNIRVLRPLFYSVDDVTPLEWRFVHASDNVKLYRALIRPKDQSYFWMKQFTLPNEPLGRTMIYNCPDTGDVYMYFVEDLERGALPLTKQVNSKGSEIAFNEPLDDMIANSKNNPLRIRLYDQFGNAAAFSFSQEDPKNPMLLEIPTDL